MSRIVPFCLLLLLLVPAGCGIDEDKGIFMAAGSYGDLAVVVSDARLQPVTDRFLGGFNTAKTFVIREETLFQPDLYLPPKWELCQGYKNVLILVRLGDGGPVEKGARKQVSGEAWARLVAGGGGVVQVKDPWATYQHLVVVASKDLNSLGSLLIRNTDRIRELFEDANRDRILRRYRYEGLATALMDAYWQRYGFFLEIPATFRQNQLEPDGFPGLELMLNAPSRGISISWKEVDDPESFVAQRDSLLAMREAMGRRLHDEEIMPSSLVWSEAVLDDRSCPKLEGAWTGSSFAGGGPFWCYFVPDNRNHRVVCLDLLVFAPSEEKMDHFRRLEAVASSFSTRRPQP